VDEEIAERVSEAQTGAKVEIAKVHDIGGGVGDNGGAIGEIVGRLGDRKVLGLGADRGSDAVNLALVVGGEIVVDELTERLEIGVEDSRDEHGDDVDEGEDVELEGGMLVKESGPALSGREVEIENEARHLPEIAVRGLGQRADAELLAGGADVLDAVESGDEKGHAESGERVAGGGGEVRGQGGAEVVAENAFDFELGLVFGEQTFDFVENSPAHVARQVETRNERENESNKEEENKNNHCLTLFR